MNKYQIQELEKQHWLKIARFRALDRRDKAIYQFVVKYGLVAILTLTFILI